MRQGRRAARVLAPLICAAGIACVGGCAELPRDADGCSERVRRTGVPPVGIAAGSPRDAGHADLRARERAVVESVARDLNARVEWRQGNPVTLLGEVEERRLPLLAAAVPSDTPYRGQVGVSRPYEKHGPDHKDYSLVVAPGENQLLLLVDKAAESERRRSGGERG